MKPDSRWLRKLSPLVVAALPLAVIPRSGAANYTWNGGGGSNANWGTAANWVGSSVPPKDGTAALYFDGTLSPLPNAEAPWAINSLNFGSAGDFGLAGSPLTIGAGGITDSSVDPIPVFNNLSLSAPQTWLVNNASSYLTTTSPIALGGNTLTSDGPGLNEIRGNISGSGGLVKNGSGTLTVTTNGAPGTNTYTGPTVINGGLLQLGRAGAISGSGITIGDGVGGANADVVRLQVNSGLGTTLPVTLNSSGLLDLNGFAQQVGQLTFNGGNVVTATGSGGLILGAGVASNASASMASISGNLNLNGSTTFNIAAGAAGAGSSGADLEISAVVANGTIFKSGAGTLRLTAANTYFGGTSITGGTLALANDAALGYVGGTLTLNGGGLRADGGSRTVGNTTLIAGNSAIAAPASFGNTITLNGPVTLTANSTVDVSGNLTVPNGVGESGGSRSLTKNGSATLSLSGTSTFSGGLTVNAGNLALNNATLSSIVTLVAGTSASLANSSAAGLNNATIPTISGTFATGTGGVTNTGSLSLPSGTTLSSTGNIDNEGTITLSTGTLTNGGGTAQILNNGQISGLGTVTAGSGGLLNNGTISLTSGRQLQFTGGTVQNAGTLALNGGTLTGTATLANTTGSIVGPGAITAALTNSGVIQPGAGTLNVAAAWTNNGVVELTSYPSNLTGGALTNAGSIQGLGSVGSAITNNGTIEAIGGTLALNGAVTNSAAGTLAAATGNKLLVTAGLPANAGVISLTGGTFDNNGRALANTGQISGYGTLRTGGLTNANTTAVPATVTLTGGVTTVNGNVVNGTNTGNAATANTGKISVLYNPVTFTGNVTNYGTFKTTATTVTFAGTFTNNGTFLSDPATQTFGNLLVGATGVLQGGLGDVFNVVGDLDNRSTQNVAFDLTAARLTLSSGAAHNLAWAGLDLGANPAGLTNNFAVGIFELGTGASVNLLTGALYVHALALDGGLGELADITGNGHNIYYDPTDPANAYLNGATYALNGGGIVSPVPEPRVTVLLLLAAGVCGGVVFRRRRGTAAI